MAPPSVITFDSGTDKQVPQKNSAKGSALFTLLGQECDVHDGMRQTSKARLVVGGGLVHLASYGETWGESALAGFVAALGGSHYQAVATQLKPECENQRRQENQV